MARLSCLQLLLRLAATRLTAMGYLGTQDGWHRHKVDSETSDLTDRSQPLLEQEPSAKQQRKEGYLAMGSIICTNHTADG